MQIIMTFLGLTVGSFLIAGMGVYATKFIPQTIQSMAIYNLWTIPVAYVANIALFWAFGKGTGVIGNLATVIALQLAIYMGFIALGNSFFLGGKLSINTLIGILLIVVGAYVMNRQ